MRVAQLAKAPKHLVAPGKWTSGRIAHAAFPLHPRNAIKLGPAFRWRVDGLETGERKFLLLTFFRADRENFGAWLAEQHLNDDILVLIRLEDHGTHPGLHVHVCCDPETLPPIGRQSYGGMQRLPNRHYRRRGAFTEQDALSLAYGFFKVASKTVGGLL